MRNRKNTLVRTVQKAIIVLEAVAKEKNGIGVTELSKKIGIDKSTTFRMLNTLEYHGYLTRDVEMEKYHLGLKLLELNRALIDVFDLRKKAHPFLEELMVETQESAYLGIFHMNELFYVDWVECSQSLRMTSPSFGTRIGSHATALGKVLMTYLPDEEMKNICKKSGLKAYTKQTITGIKKLKEELAKIRSQGYSFDDRESGDWSRCVAAPVRDYSGKVIAAISISAPAERIGLDAVKRISGLVIKSADKISISLGYQR